MMMNRTKPLAVATSAFDVPGARWLAASALAISLLGIPTVGHAQGIVRGAQEGAYEGGRAAGPVGAAVGGAVGAPRRGPGFFYCVSFSADSRF